MSVFGRIGTGIIRSGSWLVRPAMREARRNWRAWRDGVALLQRFPRIEIVERASLPVRSPPSLELEILRGRTRRVGRFYALLMLLDALWWLHEVVLAPHAHFMIASVNSLAIGTLLGSQYGIQCFANWQARTGRPQRLGDFLSDARQFWPR